MVGYRLHSSGVALSTADRSGLRCRHTNGQETPATYDPESNRVQCKMDDDSDTTTDKCDLYHGSERVCDEFTCSRDHKKDVDRSDSTPNNDFDSLNTVGPNTTVVEEEGSGSVIKSLSFVDRFLSLWIIVVMVIGVVVGYYSPAAQQALNSVQITTVSLPVAFGLWFMMYPVLVKVRYEAFGYIFRKRDTYRQLAFSVAANWVSSVTTPFIANTTKQHQTYSMN